MHPVPGYPVTTPWGLRGSYWSCHEDANGNGIHTGVDVAAPQGTKVVAARPGRVVYCNHGAAFGQWQLEIVPSDGTRDFYAHMPSRSVPNGSQVEAGQTVGKVGASGNVTGPHLHFERHNVSSGGWSCSVVVDPAPSLNYEGDDMNEADWQRMEELVRSVWDEHMEVTQPGSGQDTSKSRQQVLRELWQKVTKAT